MRFIAPQPPATAVRMSLHVSRSIVASSSSLASPCTGGLLLGFVAANARGGGRSAAAAPLKLNAWIHVGTDDVVTLFIHKAEMGQGTVTSLSHAAGRRARVRLGEDPHRVSRRRSRVWRHRRASSAARASARPWTAAAAGGRVGASDARSGGGCSAGALTPRRAAPIAARSSITATNARVSYGALAEDAAKLPVPAAPR